jgi:hypothetical protein
MRSQKIKEYLFNQIKHPVKDDKEYTQLFDFLSSLDILPMKETSIHKEMSHTHQTQISPYISDIIMEDIQQLTFHTISNIEIGNVHVSIDILSNSYETKFLNNIKHVLQFVISLFQPSYKKNININYYLTDALKQLPSDGQLQTNNVNSGSCSNNGDDCVITIWRKEEIMKVTIHELIHGLQPHPLKDTNEIIHYYQKKYNITSSKINIDETYTELWANILNCFILSYESKNIYKTFITYLSMEQLFCEIQANKIIKYTKLMGPSIDINKHTNVLAYYIIRCELFQKLPEFLKHCRKKNDRFIIIKKQSEWIPIFINKQKHNSYNITEPPVFMENTLRMTAIDNQII